MSSSLESAPCKEHLPDLFRFAFLMTGSEHAATEVLRRTVERAARGSLGELRDERRARRWLFAEARQQCAGPLPVPLPPVPGGAPSAAAGAASLNGNGNHPPALAAPAGEGAPADASALELAAAFAAMPERERGALILFYLFLFSPADLAETLGLKPAALGPVLTHARALLARGLAVSPLLAPSDACRG